MGKQNHQTQESQSKLTISERIIKLGKHKNPQMASINPQSLQVSKKMASSKSKLQVEEPEDKLSLESQQDQEEEKISFKKDEPPRYNENMSMKEYLYSLQDYIVVLQKKNQEQSQDIKKLKKSQDENNKAIDILEKSEGELLSRLDKVEAELNKHLKNEHIQILSNIFTLIRDKVFGEFKSYANFTEILKTKEPHIQQSLKDQLKERIELSGLSQEEFMFLEEFYENPTQNPLLF